MIHTAMMASELFANKNITLPALTQSSVRHKLSFSFARSSDC